MAYLVFVYDCALEFFVVAVGAVSFFDYFVDVEVGEAAVLS